MSITYDDYVVPKPLCCNWQEAWIGRCKLEVVGDHGMCFKHSKKRCASCGEQATHSCEETGQFVCGAPLCQNCTHRTFEDGTNGGVGFDAQPLPEGAKRHCRKSENVNRAWYEKEKP